MQALIPDSERPGRVRLAIVEEPQPSQVEAVVEVAAFSPNRGETFLLERPRPGWRPGKDVAGVVVRAAEDGSGPPAGARVVGHSEQGGWAERVAVPTSRLAVLPDGVPFAAAAALPLAGLTALRLARVSAPLTSRTVLLTGASGGVGHYFVELAAAQGALVTVVSGSHDRAQRLCELGAVAAVSSVAQAVGPFEVALDSVGGEVTREVWHKLEQRGLLVWFGQASRVAPALDFFDFDGAMSTTIRKFDYMDSTHSEAADLNTLVRLLTAGHLHPEIGLLEDWERAGEAIEALLARRVRGNAVLTVGELGAGPSRAADAGVGCDPETVVKRYLAALGAQDDAAIANCFTADAVWRLDGDLPISGTWDGRDAILGGFFAGARTFLEPGSTHIQVTTLLAEDDRVALEWTSHARTVVGEPYENRCAGVFTIRDGRIQAVNEYMDTYRAHRAVMAAAAR